MANFSANIWVTNTHWRMLWPQLKKMDHPVVYTEVNTITTRNSSTFSGRVVEPKIDDPNVHHSSHPWGIFFTVLGTVLLDFDADACQSPSRAYLLDVTVSGTNKLCMGSVSVNDTSKGVPSLSMKVNLVFKLTAKYLMPRFYFGKKHPVFSGKNKCLYVVWFKYYYSMITERDAGCLIKMLQLLINF